MSAKNKIQKVSNKRSRIIKAILREIGSTKWEKLSETEKNKLILQKNDSLKIEAKKGRKFLNRVNRVHLDDWKNLNIPDEMYSVV